MKIPLLLILLLTLSLTTLADDNEISLSDSSGESVAYIVLNDEFTIHTWDGEVVAYLHSSTGNFNSEMDVYGWNGDHLGWFNDGIIMNHYGDMSCVVREKHPYPLVEFGKNNKFGKYGKNVRYGAPGKPIFSGRFSEVSCLSLMISGRP